MPASPSSTPRTPTAGTPAEIGHNERLIARALASWNGDRSQIVVATKGGLTRPEGRWIADGRARHLAAACEASRRALGVERIQLYQLHAPDPRVALSTSVRALATLKRDGLIESIGLCNVTVGQIGEARRITEIDWVQNELSLWNDGGLLSGVAGHCAANGIRFLAYRPLGGPQRRAESPRRSVACRSGGAPRRHAVRDRAGLAARPVQGDRADSRPDARRKCAVGRTRGTNCAVRRRPPTAGRENSRRDRVMRVRSGPSATAPRSEGEVVLIMGLPGAGKSTLAQSFVARGYTRLNRDDRRRVARGAAARARSRHCRRFIPPRSRQYLRDPKSAGQRAPDGAATRSARCAASSSRPAIEDAQVNAASRMVAKYGELLDVDRIREVSKHDVSVFGPTVQFRYQRDLEAPDPSEGFAQIDVVNFERKRIRRGPTAPSSSGATASFFAADPVCARQCRRTTSRCLRTGERSLRRYAAEGWRLLGMSWQPRRRGRAPDPGPGRRILRADARRSWASRSRSSTARTAPGRPCAGAGNHFPASACCSSSGTSWTPRSAFTSEPGRRIRASRGGWAFSTAKQPPSSRARDVDHLNGISVL